MLLLVMFSPSINVPYLQLKSSSLLLVFKIKNIITTLRIHTGRRMQESTVEILFTVVTKVKSYKLMTLEI